MIKTFKKITICLFVGASLSLGGGITASASCSNVNSNTAVSGNASTASWTGRFNRNVTRGAEWLTTGTTCNTKRSTNRGWDIYLDSKTMTSRPVTRLGSTGGNIRSTNTLTMPSNNNTIVRTTSGNTADRGNSVRLHSRSAINQVTTGNTMRIRFSAR